MTNNLFLQGLKRYLSDQQIATIQNTHIGIAGAGGLGSNVAHMLTRCGFQHLEIIDKDIIDASNLNRQLFFLKDLQKSKAFCLKEYLLAINPQAHIIAHHQEWTLDNAADFFKDASIIIEAFDKPAIKKKYVEYYASKKKYVISGNGMAGIQTTTSATQTRQLNNIFFVGDSTTSIEDGHPVMAPRVIQCAGKMAEIVLDIVLSKVTKKL